MTGRRDAVRERNIRLRAAMLDRQVSFAELAHATGRNVKTVQRWVYEGRLPRKHVGKTAAQYLDIDPNWLWPKMRSEVNPELINLYAHIGEVPPPIWTGTARGAQRAIDIAADTIPVLPHDLSDILRSKAQQGVQVRLCLGTNVRPALHIDGVATRNSVAGVALGIYRFDDEMIVWLNRSSSGVERHAPTLHLRQVEDDGAFVFYRTVFADLWELGEGVAEHGSDLHRHDG